MSVSPEQKKQMIERLKEKKPLYSEILSFYEQIIKEQDAENPSVNIQDTETANSIRASQAKEGFPLIDRSDFVIDIPASIRLFETIGKIGKRTNEKMRSNIQAMEEAIAVNAFNLRELLGKFSDGSLIAKIAEEFDIDKAILRFMVDASIQPSIRENVAKLKNQVDLENWRRGYCPICGSLPYISRLNESGRRSFLCSFCRFEWPSDRLKCPFCENSNHEKLQYYYTDGEEAYRVDVCDECRQYIKTVDSRKLDYEPDLILEDVVTMHLDILATEKGYKSPLQSK